MHQLKLPTLFAIASATFTACGGGSGGGFIGSSFEFASLPLIATPPPGGSPQPTVVFDPVLCTQQGDTPHGQTGGVTGTNLMVTSAHYEAFKAGCKILATGGTAIDAAVAVQAVLDTAEPFASGLGATHSSPTTTRGQEGADI